MLIVEVPLYRLKQRNHRVVFAESKPAPEKRKPQPAARALALGYRILQAIESEEVRDSTEAARRMGVAQERVSVLMGLTFLAPDIQEGILTERIAVKGDTVRRLIQVAREPRWELQRKRLMNSGVPREALGQNVSVS